MPSRKISVEILGDSRSLERAFKRSAKSGKEMHVAFTGLGRAALAAGGGFFAAQGVVAGLTEAVDAASNLAEQTSKSRQVFGTYSADLEAWAKTTADSFGIANDQALEATGTFGNLFRTVHIGEADAATMSRRLVELAADLASFNNASPEDALLALRSGLVGEAEPLRRFGVRLSEARVQQEAMQATGKRSAKALTENEKALARYGIILADTTQAQGDFARTQDGFANKTRKLSASFRDLKAAIGTGLIPALSTAVDITAKLIEGANDVARRYSRSEKFEFFHGLGERVYDVADAFGYGTDASEAYDAALQRVAATSAVTAKNLETLQTGAVGVQDVLERHRLEMVQDAPAPTKVYSAEQRNEWFDAMIGRRRDRVQDVKELQGQVASLREIARLIQQRIAATKDVTRQHRLEDDLVQVQRDIGSTLDAIKERSETAKRERIELAKEAAEREALARQTRQFRALGFGAGGDDLVPGVDALRKRLGRVSDAVRGSILDTKKTRGLLATIRSMLTDRAQWGKIGDDVRARIEEILADIDRKLGEHSRRRPRFKAADPDKVLAGLGLSREQIRALSGRIAGISQGGRVPIGGASAFGVPLAGTQFVVTGPVTIKADHPDVIARELQKRARRTATQTRGTRPGSRQSID